MTTITLPRATVEQALEALECHADVGIKADKAITALKAALAEPEPRNQCAETCERAKLCAVCARGLAEPAQEPVTQAMRDAAVYGVGISRDGKRIDPASIYAQQAEPVQEPEPGEYHGWVLREVLFDNGEPVGHREPVQEPVARECSDPMCACRGGPCAECEEGQREREIEDLRFSLDFYQRRCEALQAWQCKMRDPERTIVCDILANGFTLDAAFAGDRYTAPPQRKPLTEEQAMLEMWQDVPGAVNFGITPKAEPPCPDCHGIGYDASGQTCWCQENPSF